MQEISADMKKVRLIFKKLEDPVISVDSDRLQQVTLNLLTNALKFSKKGGFVELGGEFVLEGEKRLIKIYVKDNGCGIKEADKPKLFQLFGKIKQPRASINREGIGFGLTICK